MSDTSSLQQAHYVLPSQLCVGMHVNLELNWSEHPFTFSSFVIKSADQIDKIRALNLPRVRWSPDKSTARPLAPPARRAAPTAGPAPEAPRVDPGESSARWPPGSPSMRSAARIASARSPVLPGR